MLVFNILQDLRDKHFDIDQIEVDPRNIDIVHAENLTEQFIQLYLRQVQNCVYNCLIDKVEVCIADPVFLWRSAQGTCSYLERQGLDAAGMFSREVEWAFRQGYNEPLWGMHDPISLNDPKNRDAFDMRCVYMGEKNPFELELPILHTKVLTDILNSLYATAQKSGQKLAELYS